MILAVHVGNTHIVFGCALKGEVLDPVLSLATDPNETAYGYAAKIRQIFAFANFPCKDLKDAVLSSVVPSVSEAIVGAIRLLIGKDPLLVGAGVKTGLHISIDDPGTLASDLVAAAVAAKEAYPLPCVIVDLGTATTLTCLDANGKYIGGAILPGVKISLEALAREASLLPVVEIIPPQKAIATATVESMRSGILFGAAGAIDGVLDRFAEQLGTEPASIVTTGGFGAMVCSYCRHSILTDEKLLLKGLASIYKKNSRRVM